MLDQSTPTCSIEGCDRRLMARGWCQMHYARWWKRGSPHTLVQPKGMPVPERFWSKVEKTDTCWLWIGTLTLKGYGVFWNGEKNVAAHRYAYELLVGPIPPDKELDHLCRVRRCVRAPKHLEPVTDRENALRGESFAAANAVKTHCPSGHAYTHENVYVLPSRPNARYCRACHRIRSRVKVVR